MYQGELVLLSSEFITSDDTSAVFVYKSTSRESRPSPSSPKPRRKYSNVSVLLVTFEVPPEPAPISAMGVPVVLATVAACGSLVTTMKSSWELSRMLRQKRNQRQAEEDAVLVYRSLRRALYSGRMSDREYDHWFEQLLVAESEKNSECAPICGPS